MVLGKRTRSREDCESLSTRSKRRIVLNQPNDENVNPFVHTGHNEEHEDVEEADEPLQKTTSTAVSRIAPAKHGASEQRTSPSKLSSHFRVRKPDIKVFEDAKSQSNGIRTPTTPRHRDALSKKVPITPRHKVLLDSGKATPRTPRTPSNGSTLIYQQARQLFARCSNPGKLVNRDDERTELSCFISTRVKSRAGGCLYVSGPPGTGKSALVQEVLQQFKDTASLKISVVNCMSIRNAKDLSTKLSEDLEVTAKTGIEHLGLCLSSSKSKDPEQYLVVLDEIDRLVDLDLELLYSLFEWSMTASSRLMLIGIANALDLTDRFLPRLKNRSLKPELLPFMPYSAAEIAEIVTAKLNSLLSDETQNAPFLQPAAIQFCAKKVASQTGDLRKAFDICRRAIDLVEQETKEKDAVQSPTHSPSKTPLMENINLSSPPAQPSPNKMATHVYTLETAPKASIAHVAKVTAQVFGNGTIQRLDTLNLQQKAVLCALAALEKQKRNTQVNKVMFATPSKHNSTAPSVKELFGAYGQLCKRENLLHPLTAAEFLDVISGLETLSLVLGAEGKNGTFAPPITPSKTPSRSRKGGFARPATSDGRRIASAVSQKELTGTLEGAGGDLLREILNGDVMI